MSTALTKAQKEAEALFESEVLQAARRSVRNLFDSGQYQGHTEGLAHEIIRKHVEELILSESFTKRLERIAEEVMDEEITSALKLLLHAKTRKRLFTAVEGIDPNQ
jgi:hypothetical protein